MSLIPMLRMPASLTSGGAYGPRTAETVQAGNRRSEGEHALPEPRGGVPPGSRNFAFTTP